MKPFIKWAGGKTQLLEKLVSKLPSKFNDYYKPFVGGGALLFRIQPKTIFINDINRQLINVYKTIKYNANEFMDKLNWYDSQTSYNVAKNNYLEYKKIFNKKMQLNELDIEMASLFVYLNKHCFNGLYRVNSHGLFNAPFNNKNNGSSYDKENILDIHNYLNSPNKTITSVDFEESLKTAKQGDFVFLNSPYDLLKPDTFNSYTYTKFSKEDHIRLSNLFKELDERGCYLMLTNYNTPLINELYKEYRKK